VPFVRVGKHFPIEEAVMPSGKPEQRELGYYFSLAQVGLEMVVPIAVGIWLQDRFELRPWGVVVGAVLGLAGGLAHLVVISNRQNRSGSGSKPRDDS
jgi:ATP synthase protein I